MSLFADRFGIDSKKTSPEFYANKLRTKAYEPSFNKLNHRNWWVPNRDMPSVLYGDKDPWKVDSTYTVTLKIERKSGNPIGVSKVGWKHSDYDDLLLMCWEMASAEEMMETWEDEQGPFDPEEFPEGPRFCYSDFSPLMYCFEDFFEWFYFFPKSPIWLVEYWKLGYMAPVDAVFRDQISGFSLSVTKEE